MTLETGNTTKMPHEAAFSYVGWKEYNAESLPTNYPIWLGNIQLQSCNSLHLVLSK
jgi:hypothetical protein